MIRERLRSVKWLMINGKAVRENIVKNKRFVFAIRVVKLYQVLCEQKKEYVLSTQLLRNDRNIGRY